MIVTVNLNSNWQAWSQYSMLQDQDTSLKSKDPPFKISAQKILGYMRTQMNKQLSYCATW